jgi:hypothetical protein
MTRWPEGPLFEALFPFVMERVRRAGERVVEVRLALEGTEAASGDVDDDGALDEGRRLGWVVGVLAAVSGGDVLGERREPDGPAFLLGLVRELLAGEGRVLGASCGPIVELAAGETSWELAWAAANFLGLAAGPERVPWSFERRAGRVVLEWRGLSRTAVDAWAREVLSAIPGTHFADLDPGWILSYDRGRPTPS